MLWVFQGFPDKEQPLSEIWGGEGNFSGKEIPLRLMTEEGQMFLHLPLLQTLQSRLFRIGKRAHGLPGFFRSFYVAFQHILRRLPGCFLGLCSRRRRDPLRFAGHGGGGKLYRRG